jgi:hypothetical protein
MRQITTSGLGRWSREIYYFVASSTICAEQSSRGHHRSSQWGRLLAKVVFPNLICSTFWSRIGYRTLVVRIDRVSDVLICRKSVDGGQEAR